MPMNPRLLRPTASGRFLLDRFGDAAVAYSLRRLSSRYTGPVVQVRRSSDNAEDTFTAEQVASGAMTAWVGAGNDGFIRTWFDQSGNARNVSQATAADQPKIVSSGTLHTLNAQPAIEYHSTAVVLQHQGLAFTSNPLSIFCVCRFDNNTGAFGVLDAATAQTFGSSTGFRFDSLGGNYRFGTLSTFTQAAYTGNVQLLRAAFATAAARTIFENGSQRATTTGNAVPTFAGVTQHKVGAVTSGVDQNASVNSLRGSLQELIAYNFDQTANNALITSGVNQHYKVYA